MTDLNVPIGNLDEVVSVCSNSNGTRVSIIAAVSERKEGEKEFNLGANYLYFVGHR